MEPTQWFAPCVTRHTPILIMSALEGDLVEVVRQRVHNVDHVLSCRAPLVQHLHHYLVDAPVPIVCVVGPPQSGKTHLIRNVLSKASRPGSAGALPVLCSVHVDAGACAARAGVDLLPFAAVAAASPSTASYSVIEDIYNQLDAFVGVQSAEEAKLDAQLDALLADPGFGARKRSHQQRELRTELTRGPIPLLASFMQSLERSLLQPYQPEPRFTRPAPTKVFAAGAAESRSKSATLASRLVHILHTQQQLRIVIQLDAYHLVRERELYDILEAVSTVGSAFPNQASRVTLILSSHVAVVTNMSNKVLSRLHDAPVVLVPGLTEVSELLELYEWWFDAPATTCTWTRALLHQLRSDSAVADELSRQLELDSSFSRYQAHAELLAAMLCATSASLSAPVHAPPPAGMLASVFSSVFLNHLSCEGALAHWSADLSRVECIMLAAVCFLEQQCQMGHRDSYTFEDIHERYMDIIATAVSSKDEATCTVISRYKVPYTYLLRVYEELMRDRHLFYYAHRDNTGGLGKARLDLERAQRSVRCSVATRDLRKIMATRQTELAFLNSHMFP